VEPDTAIQLLINDIW